MRVYLQVPKKGTEFDHPKIQAKQAAPGYHREFEAMMAFHREKSTITPALLAWKEDVQDDQGSVPGGYVIQFVFEPVPGVRLTDDRILPGKGRPLPKFFREFNEEKPGQIHNSFSEGYHKLKELGWMPYFP